MGRNRIEFLSVWLKREGFVFWKAVADARARRPWAALSSILTALKSEKSDSGVSVPLRGLLCLSQLEAKNLPKWEWEKVLS